MRQEKAPIEFKPLEDTNYFFNNLYVSYDLMCTPPSSYNSIGSFFFVGYGIGAIFFLGGAYMVSLLPSPMWFNILDLVGAYIPMGYLGYFIADKIIKGS